ARGAHAQAVGRVARERILADDNVDKPPELKTAGEKLVAAAYLLQAMPEPSTTSGRNLRREAQALIEQAAVQQAESSASHMRSIVHQEGRERQPQCTVRRHPRCTTASEKLPQGSDSTTRADMPATATPATSSMAGSTPLDGVDVSTPNMTGASHRSLQAPVCSAGRFVPLLFHHAFDSPPPSSSTRAR